MIEEDNNKIEQELREQFENVECKPFEEKLGEIRHRLIRHDERSESKPPKRKKKPNRFMMILSVAASFVLLFGIGLTVYFTVDWDRNQGGTTNSYEDKDLKLADITEEELLIWSIYKPDLDLLTEKRFKAGMHKESYETIYFMISGKYELDEVEIRIIVHSKYHPPDEPDYKKTDTLNIHNKIISYYECIIEESSYIYKLGFQVNDYRYYIDYKTSVQDSYLSFMQVFII